MNDIKTVNNYKLTTSISTLWNMFYENEENINHINLWSIELILTNKSYYFETVYLFYFAYLMKIDYNFIFNIIKIESYYDEHGLNKYSMVYIFYINQYISTAMKYYQFPENNNEIGMENGMECNGVDFDSDSEIEFESNSEIAKELFPDIKNPQNINYIVNYFTNDVIDPEYKNFPVMWKILKLVLGKDLYKLFNEFRKKYDPSIYNRTELYFQLTYGLLFLCKNYYYFPPHNIEIKPINVIECYKMFKHMDQTYTSKLEDEIYEKLEQNMKEIPKSDKIHKGSIKNNKSKAKSKSKVTNLPSKFIKTLNADLRQNNTK